MSGQPVQIRHAFADTRWGQMHYVEAGPADAEPVLLMHQSPRSVDEFRDVIPILAERFHVIALDSLGFGWSVRPPAPASVEEMAQAAAAVLRVALDGAPAHVVGHHTGGVVGVELAAAEPELVASLLLSGVAWVDQERREKVAQRPSIDLVERKPDGSHVWELWRKREYYYPADRPDLLERLLIDQLSVLDEVEAGHLAVNDYHMEERIGLVAAPTLTVCGELDSFCLPDLEPLAAALPVSLGTRVLPGVGVPAPDHDPVLFAAVVTEHLDQFVQVPEPSGR